MDCWLHDLETSGDLSYSTSMDEPVIDRASVHRILVVGLAAVGDVLLTTPVLRALRTAFPQSSITYITPSEAARGILKGNPDVDECVTSTKANLVKQVLRMQPFDLTIDFMGTGTTQWICLLSGARYRVGGGNAPPIAKLQPYNIIAPPPTGPHHVFTEFISTTRALGLADPPLKSVLILDEIEREFAKTFLHQFGIRQQDRWLAIQPGRRGPEPPWSAEKFLTLARKLAQKFGCRVLIFQGPEDQTPIAEEVCAALGSSGALIPVLPVRRYAAVLQRCALLVASEGGVGHIAAALGVTTIVLSTGQEISYWFPYRRENGMVALEDLHGKNLTVQDVLSTAETLTYRVQ
jgi:ADP-heptose:LPS heptosyltransferase